MFFSGLLLIGILATADAVGPVDVPAAGYIAAALTVVGAGLVIGAWLGRARILIVFGVILALALPVAHSLETWDSPEYVGQEITWNPTTFDELEDEYTILFSTARLDLRRLDFAGEEVSLSVIATFSEITIIIPADVAVVAEMDTRFSSGDVLGEPVDEVTRQTSNDPGSGDPEDGTLRLDLSARFGALEVYR